MASLVLRAFGGMSPSARDSGNDPSVADFAENVNLRFGDYRPLPIPVSAGTATAGTTLYRFETVDDFITRPGTVNFVRGPIPTDITERTYYTGDSTPKVTDTTGQVRQLGVPGPTVEPTVVVNSTAQYSTDDSAADQAKKLTELITIVRASYDLVYVGLSDADLADDFVFLTPDAPWNYSFKVAGSLVAGAFVPTNSAHLNLIDDRLGFHIGTLPDTFTWGFVNVLARGIKIVFQSGFSAALTAVTDPSDSTGVKKLLTADQVADIISGMTDALKPADAGRDAAIARLKLLKDQFVTLADTGSAAAAGNVGAVKAYYQRSEVTSAINDAVDRAVFEIFGAMTTFNAS